MHSIYNVTNKCIWYDNGMCKFMCSIPYGKYEGMAFEDSPAPCCINCVHLSYRCCCQKIRFVIQH